MRAWIATALGVSVLIAGPAAGAGPGCAPGSTKPCFDPGKAVDFNSVPDIAKQIVSEEPISQKRQAPAAETASPTPYTGPIFGATTSGKRSPTIGYSWPLQ